ncbi:substrate-binding domain-containing protein [bacterium]|nr:substrate-binding domain-containing protein [bacterium]
MATIKEIADQADVSIGTVDRVLHKRGNVSHNAEVRVLKAIDKLKYTPNIFARQLKLSRTFTFGVIMPEYEQDSGYWKLPSIGINKAAKELEAHRISIRYFQYDRYSNMSFSKSCEEALQAKLDGYLMAPSSSAIAREFADRLSDNIPCVFFDSPVPDSNGLCSIVQDSYASGYLAGRLMSLLTDSQSTIVAIRGLSCDYHIKQRINGFAEYYSENNLTAPVIIDTPPEGSVQYLSKGIESILTEYTGVKGLFISHALTYCAAQVIEKQNKSDKIHVIGYDLIRENITYLKRGLIDFLISQQSRQQGYRGIYLLFRKVVLNEAVTPTVMMPIDIITRENVDFYQKD